MYRRPWLEDQNEEIRNIIMIAYKYKFIFN